MPDQALELLHFIDQHASGEIAMPEVVTADESARRHYLVNSLMEEAIRSSQLEGASTTRPVAKEMIRTGRPPRDRSERMILNNYNALRFLREDTASRLTPGLVLELHRILTEGTLDNPGGAGRLQSPNDERVAVWSAQTNEIVHAPPAATELEGRLHTLCAFANGELEVEGFLHPVVRAEDVNPDEAPSSQNYRVAASLSSVGLLIQLAADNAGGAGGLRTKRSGLAA